MLRVGFRMPEQAANDPFVLRVEISAEQVPRLREALVEDLGPRRGAATTADAASLCGPAKFADARR